MGAEPVALFRTVDVLKPCSNTGTRLSACQAPLADPLDINSRKPLLVISPVLLFIALIK